MPDPTACLSLLHTLGRGSKWERVKRDKMEAPAKMQILTSNFMSLFRYQIIIK